MIADFPTPDTPVKKRCFSMASSDSMRNEYFVVSYVGTIKSK